MSETQLGRLRDLALFLADEENLATRLADLARHTAEATHAASCSIMLLTEDDGEAPRLKLWASTDSLPEAAWNEAAGRGKSIAGWVAEHGQPLLIADIQKSEFAPLARRSSRLGSSLMCVPITLRERIIGIMNLASRPSAPPFDANGLAIAGVAAALIGKSVQVERLQTLLRSRVAQLALAKEQEQAAAPLTDGTVYPSRIARVLAKSFYKDLAAAGFRPEQIVEAASEIIAQITGEVGRHQRRMAREKK